ncbi:MAG: hypothetical protein ACC619_00105 [Paracoccaceae bacterium]
METPIVFLAVNSAFISQNPNLVSGNFASGRRIARIISKRAQNYPGRMHELSRNSGRDSPAANSDEPTPFFAQMSEIRHFSQRTTKITLLRDINLHFWRLTVRRGAHIVRREAQRRKNDRSCGDFGNLAHGPVTALHFGYPCAPANRGFFYAMLTTGRRAIWHGR